MSRTKENHVGEPCSKCGVPRVGFLYLPGRTVCRPCKYAKDREVGRPHRERTHPRYKLPTEIKARVAYASAMKRLRQGESICDLLPDAVKDQV